MATREVANRTVPVPGTYTFDPTHTSIAATARHLMITKVRGTFTDYEGQVVVDEDPTQSSVEVTIQADSIHTGVEDRDNHLRSADFLDVENHKTLHFKSTRIVPEGDGWQVIGDLTIRGKTLPVTLEVEFHGAVTDPFENVKAVFSATTDLAREEWGLTWNVPLESGGLLVSKNFHVEIEAQLVKVD